MLVFFVLFIDVVIYLCHRWVDNEDNVSVRSDTARLVMDSEKQDCIPGVPCIYSDSVDFRIVMMTFNRAKALQTTLDALNDIELDGDSAALEIWIDRDVEDHVDSDTLKTAKEFKVCHVILAIDVVHCNVEYSMIPRSIFISSQIHTVLLVFQDVFVYFL